MLREIIESASWSDDFELDLSKIKEILREIESKISPDKIDSRTYQAMNQAKKELERVSRRL